MICILVGAEANRLFMTLCKLQKSPGNWVSIVINCEVIQMKCWTRTSEPGLHAPGDSEQAIKAQRLRPTDRVIGALFGLFMIGSVLIACGGGMDAASGAAGAPSLVTGVAATGAPLAGQVVLRDSSAQRRNKSSIIASDGSFAIDVSGMTAPFILKASGNVDGKAITMFSFAEKAGTANINPLSTVALASAAGVNDPALVFDQSDASEVEKVKAALPASVAMLQLKLARLLEAFGADGANPVTARFSADHTGLDGVFDNVTITLANGTITVTNVTSGAVIFTAAVADLTNGHFTDNDGDLPKPGSRPAAPSGVSATGGDGQLTLSWDPVAGATSYEVNYQSEVSSQAQSDDDEGHSTRLRNVTSPLVITGLATSTTYRLRVRAMNNKLKGRFSAAVSASTTATTPVAIIPLAPVDARATGGSQQVSVSWASVTGATSYNLYWSTSSGVTTANGTKLSGVTSPSVQTGLTDATNYFYIVTAVNSAGESPASTQVAATTLPATLPATAPATPPAVSAAAGSGQVTLSWPAVAGATFYNVYWSTTSGVLTTTGTVISGVSSPFVHTGLAASTTYFYVVTAGNSAGQSAASTQASATTNAPAATVPAAPQGLTALGGVGQVTVSWSAAATATSYNLYRGTTSAVSVATGTKFTDVTSPLTQTGLASGSTFFYVVTAVNGTGESLASAPMSASTTAAAIDGAALYTQFCSGCHGPLATSEHKGASVGSITSGIAGIASMRTRFNATNGTLIMLTSAQISAISLALQ